MRWGARQILTLYAALLPLVTAPAAEPAGLAEEQTLLASREIRAAQLMALRLETPLVESGRPSAVICHADDPAWRAAAADIQRAIAETTGVTLELKTDGQITPEQMGAQTAILLGHLNNNRHVARLYHNFFVCADSAFTGSTGYEIRTVHDPFGTGHNCILVGGSTIEGTREAARTFAESIREKAAPGTLKLGRFLKLKFDPKDCSPTPPQPMTEAVLTQAMADGRKLMLSPGQGRSGVSRLVQFGLAAHRYGDARALRAYRAMMLALLEYYRTDDYINGTGMRRYDRDFRDAWTHEVAILFDLLEESGVFSDQERLDLTNLIVRLGLECVFYQGWDRPASIAKWAANRDIVHNHNTFPALGVLFSGNYLKRHYAATFVDDWLKVAHGIFNGQKHTWKPLEDAAGYQWLPIIHAMIYSLSQDDLAYFEEGHAREAANAALQVMDCAGFQAAFGDCSGLKGSSGLGATLQLAGWYHRDPGFLWGARLAGTDHWFPLDQGYAPACAPRAPADHTGLTLTPLTRPCYDSAARQPAYPTKPNLRFEQTFDKLALRAGWERGDEYLLLDGFGRGNHMHFDANAIISFAKGGEPLLVDGEYIRNAPKYHNSLAIIRDGRSEPLPAVAGLARADQLGTTAFTRTWMHDYNGADWHRSMIWCRNDYILVSDNVTALGAGDYTLRCCWRPWGETSLRDDTLRVEHPPMRLIMMNADGASSHLETLKTEDGLPVGRWSQQVSRSMKTGEGYRFLNVFHAEPSDRPREIGIRRLGEAALVIARPEGDDVVALDDGLAELPGIAGSAEMALLRSDRLALAGATAFSAAGNILKSSAPVSLEISPAAGEGTLVTAAPAEVSLQIKANGHLNCGETKATAGADGRVTVRIGAGRHALRCDPFPMYPAVVAAVDAAKARAVPNRARPPKSVSARKLRRLWSYGEFDAPLEKLRTVSCDATPPTRKSHGPAAKLFDGQSSGSTTSAMWGPGAKVVIRADLADEAEVAKIVLREWQMNKGWEIGSRKLEISSDGFQKDVRLIEGPFKKSGEESFGSNVNTLMALAVAQKARQIRLTLQPARPDSAVYLAEIEIHGSRPETAARITACASGDVDGDGRNEPIAATDQGQIVAMGPGGKPVWSFTRADHGPINCLACADTDRDGRAEVIYGGNLGQLGLLTDGGQERWHASPPPFRGIRSDVMTVFPGDVSGDRKPEIICGCRSWQYLAYDAAGKMLWKSVIYAHSATVGCATDCDGDGRDEVFAGNAYYCAQMLDDDGRQLWRVGNIGPEMTAVAALPVPGPKAHNDIAFGVDGGELHCLDPRGKERWRTNLGDRVTRIARADLDGDGADEIICSAESASIFALRADGRTLWRRPLPDGAADLAVARGPSGARVLVAAGDAGLLALDAKGEVLASGETQGRAESVVIAAEGAIVATSTGRLTAFALP
ncbi:MAG TPA: PQQ-binding-like beta-propeller repeat protein [Verrucomicrobiae bacterium]|mgnify:CR=1 FL=1|nr:PQQ-binding-like beta-propeller repeat protein [Verrucomicrobiae bacterium]